MRAITIVLSKIDVQKEKKKTSNYERHKRVHSQQLILNLQFQLG